MTKTENIVVIRLIEKDLEIAIDPNNTVLESNAIAISQGATMLIHDYINSLKKDKSTITISPDEYYSFIKDTIRALNTFSNDPNAPILKFKHTITLMEGQSHNLSFTVRRIVLLSALQPNY